MNVIDSHNLERSASEKPVPNFSQSALEAFADRIRHCRVCVERPLGKPLPHEPRPVVRLSATARLLIAGQAPGVRVHLTGIPFNDPSGNRLRDWMGVDRETFYDTRRIAIVPMGFCFPGHDKAKGDLPPRRECRLTWHDTIFAMMPQIAVAIWRSAIQRKPIISNGSVCARRPGPR